ncbi:hypothetical protein, partial [Streptomyces sp. NPDC030920]|uniref:hypothetical protein n=1 Tax=Streptomyces sp. NPDC030920 TaxID=3365308 RepID=UPI00384FD30E
MKEDLPEVLGRAVDQTAAHLCRITGLPGALVTASGPPGRPLRGRRFTTGRRTLAAGTVSGGQTTRYR